MEEWINEAGLDFMKLDFMKIKNFCSIKYNVKNMRIQAIDWKKIFAKHVSGKRLYAKFINISYNSKEDKQHDKKIDTRSE